MDENYLFIDGHNFRLADDVDLQQVRADIEDALQHGNVAIARVVMDETTGAVDLLVNGSAVKTASIYRSRPATTLGFS